MPDAIDKIEMPAIVSLHQIAGTASVARGIAQGERDVAVQLMDEHRKPLPASRSTDGSSLSTQLPPSGSEAVSRVFVVPTTARN